MTHIVKAQIKGWFVDGSALIEEWVPEDPYEVDFWCTLEIGDSATHGENCFKVHIATERAVRHLNDKRYLFVIPHYESWAATLKLLKNRVECIEDVSWEGVAQQISEFFHWEYHGYIY